jgi:hypothetical protein
MSKKNNNKEIKILVFFFYSTRPINDYRTWYEWFSTARFWCWCISTIWWGTWLFRILEKNKSKPEKI